MFIHHIDVKTVFLNSDLKEEIYMDQPEGFITKGQENKVCKLVKSLYGLKQTPNNGIKSLTNLLHSLDSVLEHDKCTYSKNFGNEYIILCLYVNDIFILGTSLDAIQRVKDYLF